MSLIASVAFTLTALSTGLCNEFEWVQSVVASEALRQSAAAQLEVARAVVQKGPCVDDEGYYAGLRVAREALGLGQTRNHHARAYYDLYGFGAEIREPLAIAAHVALTERPRVPRYHFDRADGVLYAWWGSARACPGGWWIVGELRVC